ncbi:MAG: PIG-L family deacetylase [Anaerolineales bacterium]|nr:PIG-L family deacetylase [Anaerolineales bacterium]
MNWIYLSPHFDDAALSCGGLIWEQTHTGDEVSLWTIFAGKPVQYPRSPIIDELHTRWGSGLQATDMRMNEDIQSCRLLHASYHHLNWLDCIYRVDHQGAPLYPSQDSLFGKLNEYEAAFADILAQEIEPLIPPQAQVVCPLAIGNHIDHQLTRQAITKIGRDTWFYADFPYILKNQAEISNYIEKDWIAETYPISESGFQAWIRSVLAHRSQLSSFWKNTQKMENDFRQFLQIHQGITLWHSHSIH